MNFIQPNNITFCKLTFKCFTKHVHDWDHRKTSHGYFSIFPSYICNSNCVISITKHKFSGLADKGWREIKQQRVGVKQGKIYVQVRQATDYGLTLQGASVRLLH